MQSNSIIDKIILGEYISTVVPYGSTLMTKYTDNNLLVVLDGKILVIDPMAKKVVRINDYKTIEYVAYSSNTGNIYAVSKEEEDEMSASLYHYCIHCISQDLKEQNILKFEPQIEVTDIHLDHLV